VAVSPDPHHNIPTTDSSRASQEGEGSRFSSQRLGPEARYSDYMVEGSRETQAQLGESFHHALGETKDYTP